MADKMLRIAARGLDGTAKAVKSDNEGNLKVKLASPFLFEQRWTEQTLAAGQGADWSTSIIQGEGKEMEVLFIFSRNIKMQMALEHYSSSGQFLFNEYIYDRRGTPTNRISLKVPKRSGGIRIRIYGYETLATTFTANVTEIGG